MKAHRLSALALLAILALSAVTARAQSDRGTITGSVTDPNGAAVTDARVTATSVETGEVRETTTSGEGSYTLAELRATVYRITVEAQGFKTAAVEDVKVAVQVTRTVDFTLEVGAIGDTVVVTADDAPVIQTDSPVRQTNVNERQVKELPLGVSAESGGRTPLAFIFLDSNVSAGSGTTGRGTDASNFRVSGGQGLGTEILIDGASTRRAQNGTFFSEVAPGPNAFQEFTISTSSYSAEFGSSSGGIVNFTLKSGGNEFHGELYELHKNDALNANSYFNNARGLARPRDHQNNFGGNIGGPIYLPRFGEGGPTHWSGKDRAFFFFNYEGYRFSRQENTLFSVPTAAMRRGDFSELLTDPTVLAFFGGPVEIYDPTQDPAVRAVIPGNRLDLYLGGAVLDPAGLALANFFPLPNRPGVFRNYLATSTSPTKMDNYVGKTDFILSDKQRLSVSYSFRTLESIKGFGGRPAFTRLPPPFTQQDVWNQSFKSHFARVQHDYTFSPTFLNHLNLGFTRYDVANMNFGEGIQPSSFGIPAGATANAALPRVGFPGYGDFLTSGDPRAYIDAGSTFFTDHLYDNTVQIADAMTWVRGRHTMKFGGDVRIQQFNVTQQIDPGGSFNFRHDMTAADRDPDGGWPIASLVTGATEFSFQTVTAVDPGWRYFYPAVFFTDDIKLTPRLTINVGARYEISYPRTESKGRLRGFDPDAINPATGTRGALVGAAGQGGVQAEHEGLARPDYSNFGPRLGFAYAFNDKTVVRGGAGIYYAPILYGFEGGNTIEASLGYRNAATPNDACPRCRRPDFGSRQARYFLRNLPSSGPLAPVADPNDQFVNQGIAVDYFNKDYRTGRTVQYSLDVQRQLPANFAVSLGYIGHKATRLRSNFERLNAVPLDALKLGYPVLNSSLAAAQGNPDVVAYAASVGVPIPATPYPTFTGTVAQALRPFPQYGRVRSQLESNGQSWYNALQAKLDRRFSQGIQFGASYTFSKLITDASEDLFGGSPRGEILQNPYDRRSIRSVSPNNPYHVFVFNYIFELPFGRGRRFLDGGGVSNTIFGGWQVSAIHRYQSGLPLVVRDTEPGRAGWLGLVGFEGALRPNLTGQPVLTGNEQTGVTFQLVNPAAFAPARNFQAPPTDDVTSADYRNYYANPLAFFGSAPPVLDNARSLPFFSENVSVLKKTRITEGTTLEFRAEFFNIFNRHRYFGPANDLRFGDFGVSGVIDNRDIYAPREIQLGLRFIF
ncbi:MAG TPA: TonB-dependent receptor [Pyrinomonadaceae bacterium]|nr:TonB-dependent receptor [Pyrinomonadaceae bacterium]